MGGESLKLLRQIPCCFSFEKIPLDHLGGETSKIFVDDFSSIPCLGRINIQFEQKRLGEKKLVRCFALKILNLPVSLHKFCLGPAYLKQYGCFQK